MTPIIAIDFETFYSSKLKYSLTALHSEQYCASPLFDPYMVSLCDGSHAWAGHPRDCNWSALNDAIFLSHNRAFDNTVWNRMKVLGMIPADVNPSAWHCTANLTSYVCNRRALAEAVEHLFKVKLDKSARSDANNKHWPADFTETERATMLQYAKDDALWCWKLWDKFSSQWPEHERRLSTLTIEQGMFGVQMNADLLNEYILASHDLKLATEKVLPWMTESEDPLDDSWDDFNPVPTGTKVISEQCRRSGIPCPPVKAHAGAEAYDEWEAAYGPAHPWIAALGNWRSVNKLLKTFQTAKARLRPDGTMPFDLKYFGAHCLTGDSEVLTPGGWVRLDTWEGGDIAQWDPKNRVSFMGASPNKFEVTEPLLLSDAPYFKGAFTMGHTMPFFRHGSFAFDTCSAGHFLAAKSRYVPISGRYTFIGNLCPAYMRVLVAVQADGHWILDDGNPRLQFCLRKARKISRIQTLLSRAGISFRLQEFPSTPGQFRVSVSAKDCPAWLTPERKRFGSWLLDSSPAAREAFAEELLLWDGHLKTREYYSSVKSNVEWAATLLHLAGRAMTVREKPQRGNRARHFAGVVRDTDKAMVFTTKHLGILQIQSKRRTVYCPTTQTGFFLFRHSGVIAVTGNTGRWSGGSKLNFQNFRKVPIFVRASDGLMETDEKRIAEAVKHEKKTGSPPVWGLGKPIDFRRLIIPRPGKKMIISDLAQIEPRTEAWLCKDEKLLGLIREGYGVYEAFARANMGWTGGKLKDEDPERYQLTKIQVLGLGYGCGYEKFITIAASYGVDLCKDDPEFVEEVNAFTEEVTKKSGYGVTSKAIVNKFRADNPKIVALWGALDTAFKQSVGSDFVLRLPSGRALRYDAVRVETRIVPDPETGKPKRKSVFTASVGSRRSSLWGATFVENLCQAISRDVMGEHMLALESSGIRILFTVHDECVCEVDNSIKVCDVERLMSQTPDWLPGCPIGAEACETTFYKK